MIGLRLTGNRRAVPRHLPSAEPYKGGVIPYKLTDVELAYARAGRLDLIPTAEQRGLVAPSVPQRVFVPKDEPKPKKPNATPEHVSSITAEMMIADIQAKLTNGEMGEKYGVCASTITRLLKTYGLAGKRGVARQHQKGVRGKSGGGSRKT